VKPATPSHGLCCPRALLQWPDIGAEIRQLEDVAQRRVDMVFAIHDRARPECVLPGDRLFGHGVCQAGIEPVRLAFDRQEQAGAATRIVRILHLVGPPGRQHIDLVIRLPETEQELPPSRASRARRRACRGPSINLSECSVLRRFQRPGGGMVEPWGIEPQTSAMPSQRSPS
jgi:hypothetical protein